MIDLLSPAQGVGYVALVLGVAAFLQKKDKKLKFLNASESFIYCIHFTLLGNNSAAASSLISSIRTFISIKSWSYFISAIIIIFNISINIYFGYLFSTGPGSWLPVVGSCIATLAVFTLQGVPMRLLLLSSTLCWLANNILSKSVGGTILETIIALTNIATVIALTRARLRRSGQTSASPDGGPGAILPP
jgi:hypothetical protein